MRAGTVSPRGSQITQTTRRDMCVGTLGPFLALAIMLEEQTDLKKTIQTGRSPRRAGSGNTCAALAVMEWWVPFGWRVLCMGGSMFSVLLMVGFSEPRKLLLMALDLVVLRAGALSAHPELVMMKRSWLI